MPKPSQKKHFREAERSLRNIDLASSTVKFGSRDSSDFSRQIEDAVLHLHKSGMYEKGAREVMGALRTWFGKDLRGEERFDRVFDGNYWSSGTPKRLCDFPIAARAVHGLLVKAKMQGAADILRKVAQVEP